MWRNRRSCEGLLGAMLSLVLFCTALSKDADAGQRAVEYRLVQSGLELLSALSSSEVEWIGLSDDIYLAKADTLPYDLPFLLPSNKNLTIATGDGTPKALDFGGVLELLWLETGSTLHLLNLTVQGGASVREGEAADLPTMQTGWSPLWPTIDGARDHKVTMEDVTIVRRRAGCSPQLVQTIAMTFNSLLGVTSIAVDGLVFHAPGIRTIPVLIVNTTTGEEVGRADYTYSNFTATCVNETGGQLQVPPPGPPAAPSPIANATTSSGGTDSIGSSSKTWVYAVIGLAAGLAAVGAAVGVVLLLRRRRRRALPAAAPRAPSAGKQGSEGERLSLPATDSAIVVLEAGEGTPPPSEQGSIARQGSGGSNIVGLEGGGGLLSPATMWTTRVGPIKGLQLGDMIGRGCYGRVYRGRWRGSIVAVKVLEQHFKGGEASRLRREPLLSLSLSHPNIVTTYKLAVVCIKADEAAEGMPSQAPDPSDYEHTAQHGSREPPQRTSSQEASLPDQQSSGSQGGSGSRRGGGGQLQQRLTAPSGLSNTSSAKSVSAAASTAEVIWPQDGVPPGVYETLLVMEYCDRGSLAAAISSGRFLSPATHELDLVAVLQTLIEVAQGMEYIHDLSLIHGDLKGMNVLLKTARLDRRGFQAKIADFGLSRMLGHDQTHYDTSSFGTPSHAAPELLSEGKASKASDVYAFGMIVWEMVSGEVAHAGLSTFQLIATMSRCPDFRPALPPSCPPPLADLIQRCWQVHPQSRPSFGEIVEELRGLLHETMTRHRTHDEAQKLSVSGAKASGERAAAPAASVLA